MLRPRIIPCLLIKNGALVKTVNFANPKYVGDPINAVRIFNEKEVDELIALDIDATAHNKKPDYGMIKNLAAECRMPLCYGGGVKSVDEAERIVGLGVEKVAISSAALDNPGLVSQTAAQVGNQSVVVIMDVKKNLKSDKYELFTHNGLRNTGRDPVVFAQKMEQAGVGEVTINSIDQDGVMEGYDLVLTDKIRASINVPMTVLGGAGALKDIKGLISRYGIIGAAAGSLFVFKGKYRAVLINYPNHIEKVMLMGDYETNFAKY